MQKSFDDIEYPFDYQYSSSKENFKPLRFYIDHLPRAISIDIFLGYFSTSSLQLLSVEFAQFIADGGVVRIIMNHFLSPQDKELFLDTDDEQNFVLFEEISANAQLLRKIIAEGGGHFFNCLKYLIKIKRIIIFSVKYKGTEQTHVKKMILYDGTTHISTTGSVNFTASGLIRNSENLIVSAPWNSTTEILRIEADISEFSLVFNDLHKDYHIIDSSELITNIKEFAEDKNLEQLLKDGEDVLKEFGKYRHDIEQITQINEIESLYRINQPKLPNSFELKDYQIEAYKNWILKGRVGMFAMATGTGKTITAINCVLNEFHKNGYYRAIICVPGLALIEQWSQELHKFEFINQLKSSDIAWKGRLQTKLNNIKIGLQNDNFIAIITYDALKSKGIRKIRHLYKTELRTVLFIGDEVHNLGAPQFIKDLPFEFQFRIGLSATPHRKYDEIGSNIINSFFNIVNLKYTIEYNMYNAIKNGILSEFNYHPVFITLEELESKSYLEKTLKLAKYIDSETGKYRDDNIIVKQLLIKRKAIVQKAKNKIVALSEIIKIIGPERFKQAFIYVSPGYEYEYDEIEGDEKTDNLLIDQYTKVLGKHGLKVRQYTSKSKERDTILEDFRNNQYDALVAIQCLDEGVDIKQTKYAIFCSSTGNPRQFIQRRGRVLRKYGNKVAEIYDLIVVPNTKGSEYISPQVAQVELNIFRTELNRIIDFIALSKNVMDLVNGDFGKQCQIFGINNLEELINNEITRYEQHDR